MDTTDPPLPGAPEPVFLLICAWCRRLLGNTPPGAQGDSYGICSECAALYFPERDSDQPELPAEPEAALLTVPVTLPRAAAVIPVAPDVYRQQ